MSRYRSDIDGLRAIAVLLVLLFHLDVAAFGGGYVGVDVFFVVSGFVITRQVLEKFETGDLRWSDFFMRRFRRIMPALAVCCLMSFAAGLFILTPSELRDLAESVLANLVGAANLYFHDRVGYFGTAAQQKPLLHTWSLGVEWQFYLLFPLFFVGARGVRSVMLRVAAATTVSLAYCIIATSFDEKHAFYMPMARLWEFGLGCLIAGTGKTGPTAAMRSLLGLAGAAGLGLSVVFIDQDTRFPGYAALLPAAATAALLMAEGAGIRIVERVLTFPLLVRLGRISYSVYLVHWPLIAFWKLVAARPLDLSDRIAITALTIATAAISYRFVEQTFRNRSATAGAGRAAYGAAIMLACAAAAGLLIRLDGVPQRFSRETYDRVAALLEKRKQPPRCKQAKHLIDPSIPRFSACFFDPGGKGGTADVVIWGDSHAEPYAEPLAAALAERGLSLLLVMMPECPSLVSADVAHRKHRQACVDLGPAVFEAVRSMGTGTLILASRWANYGSDIRAPGDGGRPKRLLDPRTGDVVPFGTAFDRTISAAAATGAKVVVVGSVPEHEFDVPGAVLRVSAGIGSAPVTARSDYERRQSQVEAAFGAMEGSGAAIVIRPHDSLCDSERCRYVSQGGILYVDDDHLSPVGAAPIVGRILEHVGTESQQGVQARR